MNLFVTVTIRVNTDEAGNPNSTSVATLQELALAIHAAASQIDTANDWEFELGRKSVIFQCQRVGHLEIKEV